MDELSVIKFLIAEVEAEREKISRYNLMFSAAQAQAKANGDDYYWKYMNWNEPTPRRSVITDNMKKIRKLALKVAEKAEKVS